MDQRERGLNPGDLREEWTDSGQNKIDIVHLKKEKKKEYHGEEWLESGPNKLQEKENGCWKTNRKHF